MAQSALGKSKEYWRPANPTTARIAGPILAEGLCSDCGAEFATGAHFCYICGNERNRIPVAASGPMSFGDSVDVTMLRKRFGLSVPCLVFFALGITCLLIAASVGILNKAETLVQWQALQFWRVEWLLGAAAALLAGILLKK